MHTSTRPPSWQICGLLIAIALLCVLVSAWACGPMASISDVLGWAALGLVVIAIGWVLGTGSLHGLASLIDVDKHADGPKGAA